MCDGQQEREERRMALHKVEITVFLLKTESFVVGLYT